MNIEELVKKHVGHHYDAETDMRAALTELAAEYEQEQVLLFDAHCERVKLLQERIRQLSETHAIELRAYEATVQNLEQRIRELEAQRVPEGWLHTCDALCVIELKLWIDACPHCGMPRTAAAPKKGGE